MIYALEQGPTEQKIIQQSIRNRMPLPERIKNAPELTLGLELYYNAFWELSTCRPASFGVGAIPWTSIVEYAHAYGFSEEQTEDLLTIIRKMDEAFLKHVNESNKAT